jgi:hypothetical protein
MTDMLEVYHKRSVSSREAIRSHDQESDTSCPHYSKKFVKTEQKSKNLFIYFRPTDSDRSQTVALQKKIAKKMFQFCGSAMFNPRDWTYFDILSHSYVVPLPVADLHMQVRAIAHL